MLYEYQNKNDTKYGKFFDKNKLLKYWSNVHTIMILHNFNTELQKNIYVNKYQYTIGNIKKITKFVRK